MHGIIIPFRGSDGSKTRLGPFLDTSERRVLAQAMFDHVLNVACSVVGRDRVLVVTMSSDTQSLCKSELSMLQSREGHNEAIGEALARLRTLGFTTAAIIAADLPLLAASDISALEVTSEVEIVVAPDRTSIGTNALAMSTSLSFESRFGPDSLRRHGDEARRLGLKFREVHSKGLASDIDTPNDLELLCDPAALSSLHPESGAVFPARRDCP